MKRVLVVLFAVMAICTMEAWSQAGTKWEGRFRKLVAIDSVRFTSAGILGTSSFVGDSTVKTIAISGGQTTDKYFVQYTGTPGDSTLGTPTVTAVAGFLVVKRQTAHAEANQAFVWLRLK